MDMEGAPGAAGRCSMCHQALPPTAASAPTPTTGRGGRKRVRPDDGLQETAPLVPSSDTVGDHRRRLLVLPPPIVEHYAPYTSGQLLSVPERQVKTCGDQWDRYYRNNTINGYKDRHYLTREFTELRDRLDAARQQRCNDADSGGGGGSSTSPPQQTLTACSAIELVEIGCGVGNAVIPMLEEYVDLGSGFVAYGFDISGVAVDLLRTKVAENKLIKGRLQAIPHDLAEADLAVPGPLMPHPVAFGTIIFVLCSVPVPKQQSFVCRVASLIAVGGVVFVRDYCTGDLAERRFVDGKRFAPTGTASVVEGAVTATPAAAASPTYLRSNGTLSHFFSVESLTRLFRNTRCFQVIDAAVMERSVDNRREGLTMSRKFVQARFLRVGSPPRGSANEN